MALRLRRGTDAERQLITPLQGELIYATDTKKLYVGDGATGGGVLVGPLDATDTDLVNDTSPQLGGDLDLNGNNITGNGNININGTITATGNINLGDANEDEITVAGTINSSLRPALDSSYDLGTQARRWQNINATGADIAGQASIDSLRLRGNIEGADSTVLYDAISDSISVSSIQASTIDGDLTGSVFSDDSGTVLVDSINSVLSNGSLTITGNSILAVGITDEIILDSPNISTQVYGVDNNPDNMAFLSIQASRGNREAPTAVQVGDILGSLTVTGFSGTSLETKVLISGSIDAVTGTNPLPGKFLFSVHDYDGNYTTYGSLNSRGTFEMPTFKATPFANSGARDTAIPSPEAGMIIFNQNDDSTGKPQLQCYDGTSWIELH